MKNQNELILFAKKTLVFIGITAVIAMSIWSRQILISSIIGIGIAAILTPIVNLIKEKLSISNTFATFIIYFLIFVFSSVILGGLYWITATQVAELWKELPSLIKESNQFINSKLKFIMGGGAKLGDFKVGVTIEKIVTQLFSILNLGFSTISGLILSAILSFYICSSPKFYQKQFALLLDKKNTKRYMKTLNESGQILRAWFTAQLVSMFAIGLLTMIGLFLIGFKYWLPIGVLMGVFAILPYVGVLIVASLSMIISLNQSPEISYLVALVFIITQQLEGGFILPYLMKEKVSLPEAPLIIFIVLMGFWFGLLGMLIAPPVLAISLHVINELRGSKPDLLVSEKNV